MGGIERALAKKEQMGVLTRLTALGGSLFFLVNRVENQNEPKRPQKWWPFGFVLVFNSAYGNGRH